MNEINTASAPKQISDLEAILVGIVTTLNSRDVEAYSLSISTMLAEIRDGHKISLGALGTSLYRLEDKQLVSSYLTGIGHRNRRRIYYVTSCGIESFKAWSARTRRIMQMFSHATGQLEIERTI